MLVPALVRPKKDGGYEMVAGHRRKFAAALAELTEIDCFFVGLCKYGSPADDTG